MALLMATCGIGRSQGFSNLRFESPVLPLVPDGFSQVPIANALPGWAGYINGGQIANIVYDGFALDSAQISLITSTSPFLQPIQGGYSVFLQGGRILGSSAAIGQTAQINPSANSLFFLAQFDNVFSGPQITFSGQSISYFEVSRTASYATYAADISTIAGQSGDLRFTVTAANASTLLDGIFFSSTIVPEPSTYSLLGCGVLLFGAARATLKRKP